MLPPSSLVVTKLPALLSFRSRLQSQTSLLKSCSLKHCFLSCLEARVAESRIRRKRATCPEMKLETATDRRCGLREWCQPAPSSEASSDGFLGEWPPHSNSIAARKILVRS